MSANETFPFLAPPIPNIEVSTPSIVLSLKRLTLTLREWSNKPREDAVPSLACYAIMSPY